ncbi:uncharacterized protein [Palaemon carinicauda]|uniref:uncharacterized protein n=1 Tax=Palaemon carinicauda TaxID=392227 RepID=UPI0035B5F955
MIATRCFLMGAVGLCLMWSSSGAPTSSSTSCNGNCSRGGGTHSFSTGPDGTIRGVCSFKTADHIVIITYSEDRFGNIIANAKPANDNDKTTLADLERCRTAVEGKDNDVRKRLVEIRRNSG